MSRRQVAPAATETSAPSLRSSPSSNETWIQRWLGILLLVLRILLRPVRGLLAITFPASECDGLAPAGSSKAAQRFVAMMQQQAPAAITVDNRQEERLQQQPWQSMGFAECKQAATNQSSLILLCLHAPLSAESKRFCRTILPQLDSFTSNPLVMCLGYDVQSGQGAHLAQVMNASAYPLLAVLQPSLTSTSSQQVTILFRAEGEGLWDLCQASAANSTTMPLLTYLHMTLTKHETLVAEATARRLEREEAAELRRRQDDEYQETLRLDQARQEEARRQEEAQRRQEMERLAEEQAQRDAIQQAKEMVGDEPSTGGCLVRFVLPSGTKLNRRFATDATIRTLKAYLRVYCHENDVPMGRIGLSTSFPRKTYNEEHEQDLKLEEADLTGQAVLMVQDLDA